MACVQLGIAVNKIQGSLATCYGAESRGRVVKIKESEKPRLVHALPALTAMQSLSPLSKGAHTKPSTSYLSVKVKE